MCCQDLALPHFCDYVFDLQCVSIAPVPYSQPVCPAHHFLFHLTPVLYSSPLHDNTCALHNTNSHYHALTPVPGLLHRVPPLLPMSFSSNSILPKTVNITIVSVLHVLHFAAISPFNQGYNPRGHLACHAPGHALV